MKIVAVYKIYNTINDRIYIGSSSNFVERKRQHMYHINKNKHHSIKLQNHVNKYGVETIEFEIIEECDVENLLIREQYYIDTLKPFWNTRIFAESMLGTKRTEEQKKYMVQQRMLKSPYVKGKKLSEETKRKIKETKSKRIYVDSEETKFRRSLASKGRIVSTETRKKISDKLKGIKFSESHRNKLSKSAIGNKNWQYINYKSKDRSNKISKSLTGKTIRLILDLETGIYYNGCQEAGFVKCMDQDRISKLILGYFKTIKTSMIYV